MEKVKGYEGTEAYEKALRKRKVWIEPLFGEAKQWHGLDRFRLRRLWRVNVQTLLVAAGQNLKRYLAARGWGRRHGPTGSPWSSCRTRPTCVSFVSRSSPDDHMRLVPLRPTSAVACDESETGFFNRLLPIRGLSY